MKTQNKLLATPWQKRFWLEWQLAPKSLAYNITLIYQITGKLDKKNFEETVNTYLTLDYPELASTFVEEHNELWQSFPRRMIFQQNGKKFLIILSIKKH